MLFREAFPVMFEGIHRAQQQEYCIYCQRFLNYSEKYFFHQIVEKFQIFPFFYRIYHCDISGISPKKLCFPPDIRKWINRYYVVEKTNIKKCASAPCQDKTAPSTVLLRRGNKQNKFWLIPARSNALDVDMSRSICHKAETHFLVSC